MSLEETRAKIVVFAGPSLPADSRPAADEFIWRPPAQAGDIFDLCGHHPRTVMILDGFFDERPAIRHKEILSLIGEGVPVLGASSMGALRAAELHPYGMIGVGRIFRAYASGRIEGDDEVALLQGPEELDWCPFTEPLINIRATLVAAVRSRVCDVNTARAIFGCAGSFFYKERTWPLLLEALSINRRVSLRRLKAFTAWLPAGRVDLKRLDAQECIRACESLVAPDSRPPPPETPFSARLRAGRDLRSRLA